MMRARRVRSGQQPGARWSAPRWVDVLLAVLSLGTVAFALVALVQPSALVPGESVLGVRYYAAMYAARAIPLGAAVVVMLVRGAVAPALFWVAAACQLGDAAIGAWAGQPGQVVTPLLLALAYASYAARRGGRVRMGVVRSGDG